MIKKQLILFILLSISTSAFAFYQIPLPDLVLNKDVTTKTRLKENGKVIITETFRSTKTKDGYLVLSSFGTGKEELSRKKHSYFRLKSGKISVVSQVIETKISGKPQENVQINFNWEKMQANYYQNNYGKSKDKTKSIKLTNKTIPAPTLVLYFQHLIDNQVKQDKFRIITKDGDTHEMTAKISYRPEQLTIGGKKVSCYKLKMKPNMGLISTFIPDLVFWFRSKSPHTFVRYSGLQTGFGSPDVIQELVKL